MPYKSRRVLFNPQVCRCSNFLNFSSHFLIELFSSFELDLVVNLGQIHRGKEATTKRTKETMQLRLSVFGQPLIENVHVECVLVLQHNHNETQGGIAWHVHARAP